MSVLFGIEFWKAGPSKRFLELEQDFQNFKKKEEREDPEQERQIAEQRSQIEALNKKQKALKQKLTTLNRDWLNKDEELEKIDEEMKGNRKKIKEGLANGLVDLETKLATQLNKLSRQTNLQVQDMRNNVEKAKKSVLSKQNDDIKAFKEEMENKFELFSLQLQLKNAQINKKGNSILDASKNVYRKKK